MYLMAHRLSQLHEAGSMTHEQASMVKAWNTSRGREVLSLGRELLGGNGVVADFHVAKVGGCRCLDEVQPTGASVVGTFEFFVGHIFM